jgi:tetratricopeptide (TPR) repeat protein
MQQGEYNSALEWAERGLRYLERLPNSHSEVATTRVKLQYALATAVTPIRGPEHAVKAIRQAVRLLRNYPHPAIESELLIRRAIVAMRNKPPSSIRILRRALPLIESTGTRDRLAHALFLGGQAMIFCGDIPGALEWVERATDIAKQTQSISFLCGGLFNLGWIQSITGGWEQALAYFREAQQLALSYELRDRYIDVLSYEAEILTYRGDYAGARAIFDKARAMGEQLNIASVIEIASNNMAYIDLMQGVSTGDHGIGEALKTLAGPIDSFPTVHNILEVANRWALLHDRGVQVAVDSAALIAATQANVDFLCKQGYGLFQAYAFRVNAMASFHLDDPQIALATISRGVRVARRIGYAHDLARCLFWRGKIRRAVDPRAASLVRRDLNEATRLFESLGAQPELEQTLALLREIAP